MEKEGTNIVPIAHSDDKRQLTAVLAITAAGDYLPPQLLYQGKTPKCHPQVGFPDGWDVWHSENHWSNKITMKRYIEIIPFVNEKRQKLKLESTFPAAAIFDNFRGQTTDVILSLLRSHNIVPIQLPANCTDKLQPLDISVDKPMKDHLKNKFQQWYAQEVKKQLETIPLSQVTVNVGFGLQVIKIPSAKWIISGWQELEKRPEVAVNGFKKAGNLDVINL